MHESPELKKALGVRSVPTVKLHAGSLGQVANFTCGPRKVSNYRVDEYGRTRFPSVILV